MFLEPPAVSPERTSKVRLLPYVLVPGMDTRSRLFHKAQATIAKQVVKTSPTPPVSAERSVTLDRLFDSESQPGKSLSDLVISGF